MKLPTSKPPDSQPAGVLRGGAAAPPVGHRARHLRPGQGPVRLATGPQHLAAVNCCLPTSTFNLALGHQITCHPTCHLPLQVHWAKFYLAFENSLCDEYITEKVGTFWGSHIIFQFHFILANYNTVPVVLGARKEDYEKVKKTNYEGKAEP